MGKTIVIYMYVKFLRCVVCQKLLKSANVLRNNLKNGLVFQDTV